VVDWHRCYHTQDMAYCVVVYESHKNHISILSKVVIPLDQASLKPKDGFASDLHKEDLLPGIFGEVVKYEGQN